MRTLISTLLCAGTTASGAVIFVDPGVSGGLDDGTSWANAFDTLDEAIAAATSGDEIWAVGGTYFPTVLTIAGDARSAAFSLPDGVRLLGGFASGDTSASSRTGTATILDGDIGVPAVDGDNAYNIVELIGHTAGSGTRLDRLTIRNGRATRIDPFSLFPVFPDAGGAAVFCDGGTPSFVDCVFSNNQSAGFFQSGGAVYLDDAVASFNGCTFTSNSIEGAPGGAVWLDISPSTAGQTVFNDCSFSSNSVDNSAVAGGAVYYRGPSLLVTECSFTGNSALDGAAGQNRASRGGAIHASAVLPSPAPRDSADDLITIADSTFTDNFARSWGGAIVAGENTTIRGCTFSTNDAGPNNAAVRDIPRGGAIYIDTANIFDCEFIGNSATDGGASGGAISIVNGVIRNCTFTGNSAEFAGGAVDPNSVDITGCTFSSNSSLDRGGAVSGTANTTIDRCTFSGNSASEEGGAVWLTTVGQSTGLAQRNGLYNSVFTGNSADVGGAVHVDVLDAFTRPFLGSAAFNCSFYDNDATTSGDAIYLDRLPSSGSDVALLRNCILWDNPASGGTTPIGLGSGIALADVLVDYSIVEGGWAGAGSATVLNADPLFVNAAGGDLRLLATSPAIDAGRNESLEDNGIVFDRDRADRFFDVVSVTDTGVGTAPIVDMGAYERNADVPACNDADLAAPFATLDLADITAFVTGFSAQDPIADINGDSIFDLDDIAAFNKAFLLGCP